MSAERRIEAVFVLGLLVLSLTMQGHAQFCEDTIRIEQEFAQVIVHPGVRTCLECAVSETTSSTATWFIVSVELSTHGEITNGILVLYDPATLVSPGNSNKVQARCSAFGTTYTVFLVSSEFVPPTVEGETTITEGSDLHLTCGNDNPSVLRITQVWEDSSGQIIANQARLVVESVTRNYSGLYRCVLTDMQNNTKNASTELVVLFQPEVTVSAMPLPSGPASTDLLLNDNVLLVCDFAGLPKPSIQWLHNGVLLQDDTVGVNITLVNEQQYVLQLTNIRASSVGTYTCLANNTVGQASYDIDINIQSVLFQLKLFSISDCDQWTTSNSQSKISDISNSITTSIEERCRCGSTRDQIANEQLLCFTQSPQAVTYRATLYGSTIASKSNLIQFIEEWSAGNASTLVAEDTLRVNSMCRVVITSFEEQECKSRFNISTIPTAQNLTVPIAAGIAGGVVVLLIVVLCLTILICCIVKLRQNSVNFGKTATDQPPAMNIGGCNTKHHHDYIEDSLNTQQSKKVDDKVVYSYAATGPRSILIDREPAQRVEVDNARNSDTFVRTRSSTSSSASNLPHQRLTDILNHEYAEPVTRHHARVTSNESLDIDTQLHSSSVTSLLPRSSYANEHTMVRSRTPPNPRDQFLRKTSVEMEVGKSEVPALPVTHRSISNQSDTLFQNELGTPICPFNSEGIQMKPLVSQREDKTGGYESISNQTFTQPMLDPTLNSQGVVETKFDQYERIQTYEKVPNDQHILDQFCGTQNIQHTQTESHA